MKGGNKVSSMLSVNLFEYWKEITPQLTSIIITTLVICTFSIIFNVKIRKLKDGEELSGFLVLAATMIKSFEDMVVNVMGKKFKHLTPYVMYLFLYILVASIIALLGFEPLTSSLTVTLSMAVVTFVAIYYYGLRYQKFLFFQRYMYNPIDLFTQFVPILSLSFRLFGNIVAGSIVLGLLYATMMSMQTGWFGKAGIANEIWNNHNDIKYWWAGFNFLTTAFLPWLHLYFDLFDGFIQALVFSMLTLSYWANAKNGEHERSSEPVERYNTKKLRVKKIKITTKKYKAKKRKKNYNY